MESFANLKSKLPTTVREFLDFVWQQYLRTGKWPTARIVLGKWSKGEVDHILDTLSGAFLMETENGGSTTFELRFLGILCTTEGETYQALLRRYLGLLREIFFNQQERDSVSQVDAEKALGLKSAEVAALGRLIFSGFLPSSGSHSQNFDTWQISLPKALENLSRDEALDKSLDRILDDAARTTLKARLRDRIAVTLSQADPFFENSALVADDLGGSRVPVVFISYSHDSKDHKIWVLELARRLRTHGIDVRLDQWDLGFGDDMPKFMERNVTDAERVLMICTEAYVRKVDEGKGGAGYEAMIVTAELIRNLGTNKFIPVIRQESGKVVLPKCVGTRYGVNLSVGANVEEEFNKLIEQLRRMPPPTKPALGTALPANKASPPPQAPVETFSDDPEGAYQEALRLARDSDLVTWRKLVAAKKATVTAKLNLWRESVGQKGGPPFPRNKSEMPAFVATGLNAYLPLIAVAVAGVESSQPKFNQHGGLIYDLLEAPGWERTGPSIVVTMPEAAVFTFQAVLGAMAVFSNQNGLICDLATLRISDPMYSRESGPLFAQHHLIGWPRSFDSECTPAWNYLFNLPDLHPWISKAFGSAATFRECLCGHYLILSWLEFLEFLRGSQVIEAGKPLRFDVPTFFSRAPECAGGVRRVLEDREPLLALSGKSGVDSKRQIDVWPDWVTAGFLWITWVHNDHYFDRTGQDALRYFVADLHR